MGGNFSNTYKNHLTKCLLVSGFGNCIVDCLYAYSHFVGPKGKVLRVNTHLRVIRNAVWPMRAYWRNLGGELRITPGTLEAIDVDRRDSGAKLGAVLEKWMYTGKATTDDLISALRSVSVLRDDLANEISSHKEKPDAAEYGF